MQQASSPAPANQPATSTASTASRNVWIYTGYIATALALLGVLAYHFSGVILK